MPFIKKLKKTGFVAVPVIVVIFIATAIFLVRDDTFFIPEQSIKGDLLIVESWIPHEFDEEIIKAIKNNDFNRVLITGGQPIKSITLSENGKISFVPVIEYIDSKNLYCSIWLSGTPVDKTFPVVEIWNKNKLIFTQEVSKERKEYLFTCALHHKDTLEIRYINDAYSENEDRNLTFYKLRIGVDTAKIPDNRLFHGDLKLNNYFLLNQSSTAMLKKQTLKNSGNINIPISIINQPPKFRSKTYASAKETIKWMELNNIYSATIVSKDIHSKRTLISYNKAGNKKYNFGVIPLENAKHGYSGKEKFKELVKIFFLFGVR